MFFLAHVGRENAWRTDGRLRVYLLSVLTLFWTNALDAFGSAVCHCVVWVIHDGAVPKMGFASSRLVPIASSSLTSLGFVVLSAL